MTEAPDMTEQRDAVTPIDLATTTFGARCAPQHQKVSTYSRPICAANRQWAARRRPAATVGGRPHRATADLADTLREALRILESQQLVEIKRGRAAGGGAQAGLESVGRYVALLLQLRKTTLAHLEEVRSVIEPPAAEQAVIQAKDDDLDRLVDLHHAVRATSDPLSFVTAMSAFDQAVIELSGNQTLAVIAGVFRDIYAGSLLINRSNDAALAERIAWR